LDVITKKENYMLQRKMMQLSAVIFSMISYELYGLDLQESIVVNDVDSIQIVSTDFDITTTGYDGDEVEAQFYYQEKYCNIMYETRGKQLTITTKERKVFSIFNNRHGRIILKVPYSILLDISTTSGIIEVTDSRAVNNLQSTSGTIKIQKGRGDKQIYVTSGSLSVNEVTGNLTIDSTSGKILIDKVDGNLTIDATSGITEIRETKGSMSINKISGRITGKNIFVAGTVNIMTTSGNVSMDFNNPIEDLNLVIKTNSGAVRVGELKATGNMTLGTGSTVARISTTSGNIEID